MQAIKSGDEAGRSAVHMHREYLAIAGEERKKKTKGDDLVTR
jgi:hypothetical protein